MLGRLKKTMFSVDTLVDQIFEERFGIKGVSFSNIEQVYNPYMSGIPTMNDTQEFLVKCGMTEKMAEELKGKYLQKVKKQHTVTIMDLFSDAKA